MNDFDARAASWDEDKMKVERAASIADIIKKQMPLSHEMKALEYGCGTGLVSFNLVYDLESITMADSSEGMLDVLRAKIKDKKVQNMFPVKLDLSVDPMPEQKFDLIYTSMTLHHIPDAEGVLKKFSEMLKSGGYLCIADLDEEDGTFHPDGFDGHNGFKHEYLTDTLEGLGLNEIHYETAFQMTRSHMPPSKVYNVFVLIAKKEG